MWSFSLGGDKANYCQYFSQIKIDWLYFLYYFKYKKKKGKISIYKEQVIILKKIKNYVNLNNLPKQ